jgi:hypothetical protein
MSSALSFGMSILAQMKEFKIGGPIIFFGILIYGVCNANGLLRSYIPEFWWTKDGFKVGVLIITVFGMTCEGLFRGIKKLLSNQSSRPVESSSKATAVKPPQNSEIPSLGRIRLR